MCDWNSNTGGGGGGGHVLIIELNCNGTIQPFTDLYLSKLLQGVGGGGR